MGRGIEELRSAAPSPTQRSHRQIRRHMLFATRITSTLLSLFSWGRRWCGRHNMKHRVARKRHGEVLSPALTVNSPDEATAPVDGLNHS